MKTKYNDECVINVYVYHKCQMFIKCDGKRQTKKREMSAQTICVSFGRTHRSLFTFLLLSQLLCSSNSFLFSLEIDENVVSICNVL